MDTDKEALFSTEQSGPGSISGSGAEIPEPGSQTLLRRSRRILGEKVELGKAPARRGKSENTPRNSEAGEVSSKRREQVRQAQRTHRARTQAYLLHLEQEVLTLRQQSTSSLTHIRTLESQVQILIKTLHSHNIAIPVTPPKSFIPGQEEEVGHVMIDDVGTEGIEGIGVQFPSNSTTLNVSPIKVPDAETLANMEDFPAEKLEGFAPAPDPASIPSVEAGAHDGSILHDPRVGIDFILALERSCLPHLQDSHLSHPSSPYPGSPPHPHSTHTHRPSGHLFTASLSLLSPPNPNYASNTTSPSADNEHAISATQLNRLLNSSLNIGIGGGEITPVQIWHRLKSFALPVGREQQVGLLGRLVDALGGFVECLQ
ncbi:hypothetical protein B7494_g3421 [Chlorociboria aeruginascens]|nr:hypothetical protein B7494_g3421 [Chlorociboria aeruginascens]